MSNLLTQNSKMKRSGVRVFNFTLPALETCPNAGACAKGCYAMQGAYRWSNVYKKHKANLLRTKQPEFEGEIITEVRKKRVNRVRIHDAGDFYDEAYLTKWVNIANACPDVEFYAYTKMVEMFKTCHYRWPDNLTIIFSYGGKQDNLIDQSRDRHSQVFACKEDLEAAGYIDASKDDSMALCKHNHRVGLVYHGAKSKEWVTQ